MKILRVEASHVAIPYRTPYSIGRLTIPTKHALVLKLVTDQGIVGYGEGGSVGDAGEGIQFVMRWLGSRGRNLVESDLFRHPFDVASILDVIPNPVLECAVDHALHDIIGKALGTPLYRLLGGGGVGEDVKKRVAVARSVKGTATGAELADTVVRLRDEGYQMLTIGVGLGSTPEADIARFAGVRKAVGDDMALEVDANGGWKNADVAIDTIRKLEEHGLVAAEQPVHRRDLDGMARVTSAVKATIIAHESAGNPRKALEVIQRKAADVIAITLPWYGGLLRAKGTAHAAAMADVRCSLASGHPLGIGTAALGHLAASTPTIQEPIGYGAPRERLVDDILTEDIPFRNGYVSVLEGAGLGVEVDDEKLEKYRVGDVLVITAPLH